MKKIIIKMFLLYNKVLSIPAIIYLKLWGVKFGKNLKVYGMPIIRKNKRAKIVIGNNVTLTSKSTVNTVGITNPCILVCNGERAEIIIGDDTGLSGIVINARRSIKIGNRVLIGGNVRIFDHDFHPINYRNRSESSHIKTKPIIIKDDVFIGTNTIILKGVEIGRGAVIGAGSVVTKSIPSFEIWSGNPAVKIGEIHGK
jgi:acetyltransferase-like isoleucine patch superfamily enzyme